MLPHQRSGGRTAQMAPAALMRYHLASWMGGGGGGFGIVKRLIEPGTSPACLLRELLATCGRFEGGAPLLAPTPAMRPKRRRFAWPFSTSCLHEPPSPQRL
jgi:hypothetical protein